MERQSGYKLVKLREGVHSIHSLEHAETLHPAIGPEAEAEALYVRQLRLVDRIQNHREEFIVWDVGLGGAANALAVIRATQHLPCSLRLMSFDHTVEPLRFALKNTDALPYLSGYEAELERLLNSRHVHFQRRAEHRTGRASNSLNWDLHLEDFPELLKRPAARALPKPNAILFDPYSPVANPAMWTLPLFTDLFQLLAPERACALSTYSRSTMLRVTLLLAGFFVGVGHGMGRKEETTVAANTPELISEPLEARWLDRARRSQSAEPLHGPIYRQAPLSDESLEQLRQHPQFV